LVNCRTDPAGPRTDHKLSTDHLGSFLYGHQSQALADHRFRSETRSVVHDSQEQVSIGVAEPQLDLAAAAELRTGSAVGGGLRA